ncbi:imidazolonepropionase [candidate division GN15 bacterium]|uniref:Imidazolonepropionase n=1 Tax=candidate division GN15 bacterium TaxID=2072418 RepID=A0A855X1Y0_9BACT|nr:MAG: imidazolonepropionase [candidate division GN15 bacterium]
MVVSLLITNIGQLLTMQGAFPRRGKAMSELGIIRNAAVAIDGDRIVAVGAAADLEKQCGPARCPVIDTHGALVTPGLIDPHTHPVFSTTREDEFEMRLQGKSYMEIAQGGGGIRRSVRDLRSTPVSVLLAKARLRLDRFLEHGVTTIEAKSGYGLSTESELKQLEIIRELDETHPVDMVPTFLGAHEFPDEYRENREGYIHLLIDEMLPAVAERKLAVFSDIFCEEGVFDNAQSRRIQEAALKHGLKLKFHADELASTGGAELAASLKAVSADHLVYISDNGIAALAASGTAAVLLPGTSYSLGSKKYAPARQMIEAGVVVALSTDCNPGSNNSESLAMMMSLASVQMKMTAAESMSAVTVNAAYAVGRDDIGVLAPGKLADLVIWDAADVRELPYHYGVNLVRTVVKRGELAIVCD